jgi:hypothetical protein
MVSDDFAPDGGNDTKPLVQYMTLRGNVFVQGSAQANHYKIWAMYNDEASGNHNVTFDLTAVYNTVITMPGVDAIFIQVDNGDGTPMRVKASNNIIAGTKQPIFVSTNKPGIVSGSSNWLQTGADTSGLTESIFGAQPGFANADALDFALSVDSGCFGTANALNCSLLPTAEYYKNEVTTQECRARATARDVGAFERTTVGPGSSNHSCGHNIICRPWLKSDDGPSVRHHQGLTGADGRGWALAGGERPHLFLNEDYATTATQIRSSTDADRSHYDFVWAASPSLMSAWTSLPAAAKPLLSWYLPYSRDITPAECRLGSDAHGSDSKCIRGRNITWYQQNQKDWIMCDWPRPPTADSLAR